MNRIKRTVIVLLWAVCLGVMTMHARLLHTEIELTIGQIVQYSAVVLLLIFVSSYLTLKMTSAKNETNVLRWHVNKIVYVLSAAVCIGMILYWMGLVRTRMLCI